MLDTWRTLGRWQRPDGHRINLPVVAQATLMTVGLHNESRRGVLTIDSLLMCVVARMLAMAIVVCVAEPARGAGRPRDL